MSQRQLTRIPIFTNVPPHFLSLAGRWASIPYRKQRVEEEEMVLASRFDRVSQFADFRIIW
jgi:hypothetical protein